MTERNLFLISSVIGENMATIINKVLGCHQLFFQLTFELVAQKASHNSRCQRVKILIQFCPKGLQCGSWIRETPQSQGS